MTIESTRRQYTPIKKAERENFCSWLSQIPEIASYADDVHTAAHFDGERLPFIVASPFASALERTLRLAPST